MSGLSGRANLAVGVVGQVKKLDLKHIDMEWKVSKLRQIFAESANVDPEEFEFIFCGRKLNDKSTLTASGVKPGATIHILKRPVAVKEQVRDEAEIQELINGFGNLRNSCVRAAALKLGTPASLERLLTAVPHLRGDPVAIALISDPESFLHVLDFNKAKKVFMEHPALADACPHIMSILFENMAASSTDTPAAPRENLFSLEALSDEDDMDDASQEESDSAQGGDDLASIARFLLSESGQGTANNGESSSTGTSIITPEMLGQALNDAIASRGMSSQLQERASNDGESEARVRYMFAQMHELGLRDDVLNMQALQACDMNLQEAINLLLSGGMVD